MSDGLKSTADLSLDDKRALLAQLLRERAGAPRMGPLSPVQERLWFLDRLNPGLAAYHLQLAIGVSGRLDTNALEGILNEIVRRHEILRTTFDLVDGQPVQISAPLRKGSAYLRLEIVDLREWPAHTQYAEVQRLAVEAAWQPFDLARGPLLRATLLCLAETEHVLLLTMHHIISDGWSLGILMREIATLYLAFGEGRLDRLPALPVQYADFARWQRHRLQGETVDRLLGYWRQQLDSPPLLDLPTDRPRPPIQIYRGARHRVDLPKQLADALRALSRAEGVTLFMTLLAALQALIQRYTSQDDLIVGSPIAGRTRPEVEGLIGFFVNTLALRIDLSGDPTFRELLRRTRVVALGAYDHQELPFEKLVEQLRLKRDLSRSPLFQVMFVLQDSAVPTMELPGLTFSPLHIDRGTAQFDLSLHLYEGPEGLNGVFEYNTSLFDAATIARMTGHLQTLLEGVVAHPQQRLSELPILTAAEQEQLLIGWNATATSEGQDSCLHALIETQAARMPNATALIFGRDRLTYHELNRRANQLAHYLGARGVGRGTLVGVCAERSIALVIGLLGILKAGGAYIPLDPTYPPERLASMIRDADPLLLLTHSAVDAGRLMLTTGPMGATRTPAVLDLDANWPQIARFPDSNPGHTAQDDDLAYVIYTSGSTGHPKGAMNTHHGVVNRLLWMQATYQLNETDRVLQKTPFSFDVSVWEFFWPLLTGAGLVLAQPGGHRDNAYLVRLVAQQRVSVMHFVPPMLRMFLEEPGLAACASLRLVICSGEALPFELQAEFFARLGAQLHNLYGPTEAAIDVSSWPCRPQSERPIVPIGRPIANIQLYVLDRYLRPVPVGVPGELHIGGVGLARGYLKRPDLTAERFIPNPFAGVTGDRCWVSENSTSNTQHPSPNTRLYKTGDLVRYLPDGNIEYLGRIDHQVKLRGFRIELGEIDATLLQHPAVAEAVVLAREDVPGEKRLVAYIVVGSGARRQESGVRSQESESSTPNRQSPIPNPQSPIPELREFLKQRLPEYMVPSAFVVLDALPLSSNGKVNRWTLPPPEPLRPAAYRAPQTDLEGTIAAVWREALGIEQVGVNDNFFDLGGHSLLMTQVQRKLHALLDCEIAIIELFTYPTINALAEHLSRRSAEPVPPTQRVDEIKAGQQRLNQQLQRRLRADKKLSGAS